MNKKEFTIVLLVLLIFGVMYRLLDYPPNFTPIAAISLFAGYYFRSKWVFVLPLSILLISDIFIGFYNFEIMLAVYLCFAIIPFLGFLIKGKNKAGKIIFASLTGSILFFVITNFAVWFFGNWYSHDFGGLISCYAMAIPFFRNTLTGDLFFSGVVFGSFALYKVYAVKLINNLSLCHSRHTSSLHLCHSRHSQPRREVILNARPSIAASEGGIGNLLKIKK